MPVAARNFAEIDWLGFPENSEDELAFAEKVSRDEYNRKHEIYRGVFRKRKAGKGRAKLQFRNSKILNFHLCKQSLFAHRNKNPAAISLYSGIRFNNGNVKIKFLFFFRRPKSQRP